MKRSLFLCQGGLRLFKAFSYRGSAFCKYTFVQYNIRVCVRRGAEQLFLAGQVGLSPFDAF